MIIRKIRLIRSGFALKRESTLPFVLLTISPNDVSRGRHVASCVLAHRAVKIETIHRVENENVVGETEMARSRARNAYSLFSKLKFRR